LCVFQSLLSCAKDIAGAGPMGFFKVSSISVSITLEWYCHFTAIGHLCLKHQLCFIKQMWYDCKQHW